MLPQPVHILVVDDDTAFQVLLSLFLRQAGYTVQTVGTGQAALDLCLCISFDLVLLDGRLPDMDGFAVCAELRLRSYVPIIMLTALNHPSHIVNGLRLGADDYLAKPCRLQELAVRIQAVLRRSTRRTSRPVSDLADIDIVLGDSCHEVWVRSRLVHLTLTEYQLLHYLMSRPDEPVSRKDLFWLVRGSDAFNNHLIEVAIRHLREKIEVDPSHPRYLLTVRGAGYKFNPQPILHKSKSELFSCGG